MFALGAWALAQNDIIVWWLVLVTSGVAQCDVITKHDVITKCGDTTTLTAGIITITFGSTVWTLVYQARLLGYHAFWCGYQEVFFGGPNGRVNKVWCYYKVWWYNYSNSGNHNHHLWFHSVDLGLPGKASRLPRLLVWLPRSLLWWPKWLSKQSVMLLQSVVIQLL